MKLFTDVLRDQRNGALVDEITEELARVVRGVVKHGKRGEITLTLKVNPAKGGAYFVYDEVKAKIPEADREATIFYATADGDLSRNDPRQQNLEFRSVDTDHPKPNQEAI